MTQERRLDVGAGDVLAAADDDVLGAAGHVKQSVLDAAEVAGVDPTFGIDDSGIGLTPVAKHLARGSDQDFPNAVRLD